MEDLEAANLEDVRSFFETFYLPNNAVLTVAGDFDDDVLAKVERYFGDIPAGAPVRQPTAELSMPEGMHRDVLPDNVKLTRIYKGFQVPRYATREWYAADLLSAVLADGKSSLLYEDLVYHRQLAQDVSCAVLPTELAATLAITTTLVADGDALELEDAIDTHLEQVADGALTERHLERARNRLLLLFFHQFQTLERRADVISQFTTFYDAPERATEEARIYQELTLDDLSAVARDYLNPSQHVVVTVVPDVSDEAPPADQPINATGGASS